MLNECWNKAIIIFPFHHWAVKWWRVGLLLVQNFTRGFDPFSFLNFSPFNHFFHSLRLVSSRHLTLPWVVWAVVKRTKSPSCPQMMYRLLLVPWPIPWRSLLLHLACVLQRHLRICSIPILLLVKMEFRQEENLQLDLLELHLPADCPLKVGLWKNLPLKLRCAQVWPVRQPSLEAEVQNPLTNALRALLLLAQSAAIVLPLVLLLLLANLP